MGLLGLLVPEALAQSAPAHAVLVVFSRSEDLPANVMAASGFRDILRAQPGPDIEYHSENL